jgi:hypothetical protein
MRIEFSSRFYGFHVIWIPCRSFPPGISRLLVKGDNGLRWHLSLRLRFPSFFSWAFHLECRAFFSILYPIYLCRLASHRLHKLRCGTLNTQANLDEAYSANPKIRHKWKNEHNQHLFIVQVATRSLLQESS